MPKKQTKKLGGVSSETAKKATGHTWPQWVSILDQAGAKNWNHKQIVAYLKENHRLSPWWQQTVTVAYEKSKGRRIVGQTAATGFQVGVQKTVAVNLDDAWKLLSSRKGIERWLGKTTRFSLTAGKKYKTDNGVEGEIRVVKPADRVRLTWHRSGMKRPATLQIALLGTGPDKTSFRVHLEHLPSQKFREEMKAHWRGVLEGLAELVEEYSLHGEACRKKRDD